MYGVLLLEKPWASTCGFWHSGDGPAFLLESCKVRWAQLVDAGEGVGCAGGWQGRWVGCGQGP